MTSTLLPPPADDPVPPKDDHYGLKPKKAKTIQPLSSSDATKPQPSHHTSATGTDEALLEELRKKTAALAAQSAHKRDEKIEPPKEDRKQPEEQPLKDLESTPAPQPTPVAFEPTGAPQAPNQAVELVRGKIARLYEDEPNARAEAEQAQVAGTHRSKHQQYMYDLTSSGKSLEEIQTQWHQYYINLPEREKHVVWREFHTVHGATSRQHDPRTKQKAAPSPPKPDHRKPRSPKQIRSHISRTTQKSTSRKLTKSQHAKSLLFGVAMGGLSLLLVTFVFFNEAYVAPFVSPGQSVSATPIIGDLSGLVDPEPKIVIPKINLEVPVVFELGSISEIDIQNALEGGVVHYSNSPNPGERGNSVIVGHSSNNILNSGKYKFAFVLLRRLDVGDTFFVYKDGVRYAYEIFDKKVVPPTDLSVLGPRDRPSTMTLITCDPPGTSLNRLIIAAEQISPDPSENAKSTALELEAEEVDALPSNAPSLWSRLWPF